MLETSLFALSPSRVRTWPKPITQGNRIKLDNIADSNKYPGITQGEFTIIENGVGKTIWASQCIIPLIYLPGGGPGLIGHMGNTFIDESYIRMVLALEETGVDLNNVRIDLFASSDFTNGAFLDGVKEFFVQAFRNVANVHIDPDDIRTDLRPGLRNIALDSSTGKPYNLTKVLKSGPAFDKMFERLDDYDALAGLPLRYVHINATGLSPEVFQNHSPEIRINGMTIIL